jgi:hypothetical protein
MLKIVNMIPKSWSDDENQDCEPNLSVNPANPKEIIATAFTFDNPAGTSSVSPAMTGNWAPLFSSVDGGDTWTLQFVLPSTAGDQLPTWDVTSRYGGSSGEVYSGLISPGSFTILINRAPNATTQQTNITSVTGDQPFLEATTAVAGGVSHDRLFVGYNANGSKSTVNVFLDAKAAAPATTVNSLDVRFPFDMPPTRTAIHSSGTIYCAYYSYNGAVRTPTDPRDVVIVKDLDWGASSPAFQALVDAGDGKVGVRIATGITNPWYNSNFEDPSFGNDRYGPELAIAVDPKDVNRVFIVYATGTSAADEALHLRSSGDGGQTWSADLRIIPTAKNPSIAINDLGMVGFVYQQVVGANWMTVLEVSDDGFASSFSTHILCNTPTNAPTPASVMATYLGDYIKLQATGVDFYGIFSASNAPAAANFPSGITYQRNVNWATQTLLGNDGVTPVPVSIDPFFFKLSIEVPVVATAIANSGFFGDVCLGSFVDEMLTINNRGGGMLRIFKIVSTLVDFEVPGVLSYPLKVGAGDSIDLMIRFKPTAHGFRFGKIEIFSNDPASPHMVDVSGECPVPRLSMIMANQGNFGNCCVGSFVDEPLIVTNSGKCMLTVTAIASTSVEFLAPQVLSFPITVGPGDALTVPIRFQPTSFGAKSGTITVSSDDPAGPLSVNVSGDAPSGKLAVSGSTNFGGVNACCCADRTVSVCNVGDCALTVTSVHFKRKSHHWKLLNNPFPAKLHPGSCLPVVIQYHATEKCPRPCELVIESDDPVAPVELVEVLAYTVWDCCCKEDEHCEDCRKGCCHKHHHEPGCQQGYPCCGDDDDDEECKENRNQH